MGSHDVGGFSASTSSEVNNDVWKGAPLCFVRSHGKARGQGDLEASHLAALSRGGVCNQTHVDGVWDNGNVLWGEMGQWFTGDVRYLYDAGFQ